MLFLCFEFGPKCIFIKHDVKLVHSVEIQKVKEAEEKELEKAITSLL